MHGSPLRNGGTITELLHPSMYANAPGIFELTNDSVELLVLIPGIRIVRHVSPINLNFSFV